MLELQRIYRKVFWSKSIRLIAHDLQIINGLRGGKNKKHEVNDKTEP